MARAVVFVDDAVRGDLPDVCVKTGQPATRVATFDTRVGGLNPLWFLFVVLGPVAWVLLVLLAFRGGEPLTVRLPVSDETAARWAELRRDRRLVVGASVVAAIGLVVALRYGGNVHWLVLAVVGACALGFLVTQLRLHWAGVDVDLDASRRWVSLTGVSSEFAAAVLARSRPSAR